jgi:hypothetical protein
MGYEGINLLSFDAKVESIIGLKIIYIFSENKCMF